MATEAEKCELGRILQPHSGHVIVEVGAHIGEEARMFSEMIGYPFTHIMIEPDLRNVQKIIDSDEYPIGIDRRLIVGAVSDSSGYREFYASDNSIDGYHSSGSLLEPTGHLKRAPHVTFPLRWSVMCYTLDEIYGKYSLDDVTLLFTDVQGSEAAMIRGGQKALAKTRYLFMEVETVEMYRGQALRNELIGMLSGWNLKGDFGCNVLMENQRLA